jgi:hypothetical protein
MNLSKPMRAKDIEKNTNRGSFVRFQNLIKKRLTTKQAAIITPEKKQ